MRFDLSETQKLLQTSTREFLRAECPIAEVRRLMETDTAHDDRLWRKMAEQGWTGLPFAEEYDGSGLGLVDLAVAMEEMGRAALPGPFLSTLVAGLVIDAAASDEHKRKYLAPICRGEAKATIALLEEGASWDPNAVRMNASSGQLDGRKLFVGDAAVADFIVCVARDRLVMVDAKAPGLWIKPMPAMDTTRRMSEVVFRGVAASDVLAHGAKARAALERALDVGAAALVAEMVGGMQRVLDLTVAYAKDRKQFGKPIGQFQAIQHHCADMLVWTESSRSAAYYAAYALAENIPDAAAAVSVAKAYASDACRQVGNFGVQVHGGNGFTWDNDVHIYYKRFKASEVAFGDATWHRERIARLVIDCRQSVPAQA